MIRKIIKISAIVLIVIFLILLGAWLVGRKQAQDAGKIPLTFREFLNLSSRQSSGTKIDGNGDLIPDFQEPDNGASNNGTSTGTEGGARVSQFTGNTIIPSDSTGIDSNIDTGLVDSSQDDIYSGNDFPLSGTDQEECGDEDTNITFTQDEINRLQALQDRFYSISQYLHDDNDVAIEIANHDSFKTKVLKIKEYYDYCEGASKKVTDAGLQTRVATPFWHDATRDSTTFIPKTESAPSFMARIFKELDRKKTLSIEKMLRLNLW